jgi:hypothetical protein
MPRRLKTANSFSGRGIQLNFLHNIFEAVNVVVPALVLSQFCNMFSPKYAIFVLTVIALVKKLPGHVDISRGCSLILASMEKFFHPHVSKLERFTWCNGPAGTRLGHRRRSYYGLLFRRCAGYSSFGFRIVFFFFVLSSRA